MTTHLEALRAQVRKWREEQVRGEQQALRHQRRTGEVLCAADFTEAGTFADELEAALGSGPDGKMGEAGASGPTETGKVEALPTYLGRKHIGSPVGYVDSPRDGHARFCRLNDLEHVPHGTKVYAIPDPVLEEIRRGLQTMINSAEVFIGNDDTVTAYKIKTGAIHRIIGAFADADESLTIPANLPAAPPSTQREEDHSIPLEQKPTYYLVIYEANGPGAYASSVFDWPPSKESLANFKRYGHKVVPLYTHPPLAKMEENSK
jgi:hypothetical protein